MKGKKGEKKEVKKAVKASKPSSLTGNQNVVVQTYKPTAQVTTAQLTMMDILKKAKTTNIISKDVRETLVEKLENVTSSSSRFREDIIVGFNSVCKTLEKEKVDVMCMARRANDHALQFLMEACLVRKIPLVVVPFTPQLLAALKVRKAFCFTIRSTRQHDRSDAAEGIELDVMDAAIDDLSEFLLSIAHDV